MVERSGRVWVMPVGLAAPARDVEGWTAEGAEPGGSPGGVGSGWLGLSRVRRPMLGSLGPPTQVAAAPGQGIAMSGRPAGRGRARLVALVGSAHPGPALAVT